MSSLNSSVLKRSSVQNIEIGHRPMIESGVSKSINRTMVRRGSWNEGIDNKNRGNHIYNTNMNTGGINKNREKSERIYRNNDAREFILRKKRMNIEGMRNNDEKKRKINNGIKNRYLNGNISGNMNGNMNGNVGGNVDGVNSIKRGLNDNIKKEIYQKKKSSKSFDKDINKSSHFLTKVDSKINRVIYGKRPLLSNTVNDVVNERYNKYIHTVISVDSRDRRIKESDNCGFDRDNCDEKCEEDSRGGGCNGLGKYIIDLNHDFKNIVSIELVGIDFPKCLRLINQTNHKISWRYLSAFELNDYSVDLFEYDAPLIHLPTNCVSIPHGNYTVDGLRKVMMDEMSKVIHVTEEGYSMGGKMSCFYVAIHADGDEEVIIINRMQELVVNYIEVITSESDVLSLDDCKIEVAVKTKDIEGDHYFQNYTEMGVILTGIPACTIGGIPSNMMIEKEFKMGDEFKYLRSEDGSHIYELILKDDKCNKICGKYCERRDFNLGEVLIGQGLPFVFVFKDGASTLLEFLGWCNINYGVACNKCVSKTKTALTSASAYDIDNLDFNDGLLIEEDDDEFECQNMNSKTWSSLHRSGLYGCLNIKMDCCGNYVFECESSYIFMRLSHPSFPDDFMGNNLIKASSYGIDRGTNDLFAKIIFSSVTGNLETRFISNKKMFYNRVMPMIDKLEVEFLDRNGRTIKGCRNHNFTLEIVEKIEVLKETLIDSRTGSISKMGNDYKTR